MISPSLNLNYHGNRSPLAYQKEREVFKAMAGQIIQKKMLEEIRDSSFLSENISQVS